MASLLGPYLTKAIAEKKYAERAVGLVALSLGVYTLVGLS